MLRWCQAFLRFIHFSLRVYFFGEEQPDPMFGRYKVNFNELARLTLTTLKPDLKLLGSPTCVMVEKTGDRATIRYRPGMGTIRTQFAIAHAFGHILSGHENILADSEYSFFEDVEDNQDWQANLLACRILMPDRKFCQLYRVQYLLRQTAEQPTDKEIIASSLAPLFAVTKGAVLLNIKRLESSRRLPITEIEYE